MKVDRGPTLKLQIRPKRFDRDKHWSLSSSRNASDEKKNMASPLGKSLKVLCASISLIPGYENEIGFPEKTGNL